MFSGKVSDTFPTFQRNLEFIDRFSKKKNPISNLTEVRPLEDAMMHSYRRTVDKRTDMETVMGDFSDCVNVTNK